MSKRIVDRAANEAGHQRVHPLHNSLGIFLRFTLEQVYIFLQAR